jgi:hypothetical protein
MRGKKTGGRRPGSLNRRSVEAIEIFGAFEFCPLEKILTELQRPGISQDLMLGTCIKLMEFKFPKRKAIEHTVDLDRLEKEELIAEAKKILKAIESEEE